MNQLRYLDSCIQILKAMRGDKSNELGSEQQRALGHAVQSLKRLKKQPHIKREELYRTVSEIAETVSRSL